MVSQANSPLEKIFSSGNVITIHRKKEKGKREDRVRKRGIRAFGGIGAQIRVTAEVHPRLTAWFQFPGGSNSRPGDEASVKWTPGGRKFSSNNA
jgi:hypothetical protein